MGTALKDRVGRYQRPTDEYPWQVEAYGWAAGLAEAQPDTEGTRDPRMHEHPMHLRRDHRSGWKRGLARALVVCAMISRSATGARAAEDLSDAEFATGSIVVVARVSPGSLETRVRKDRALVVDQEQRVPLQIDKVIAGKATPGRTTVLLQDGYHLQGSLSQRDFIEPGGDTQPEEAASMSYDVHSPQVWLLERGRSVDPDDSETYFVVRRRRAVQPLALEPWFAALAAPDAARRAPLLLAHADPKVAAAALAYVAGGRMPWPRDSNLMHEARPAGSSGPALSAEAPRVRKLLASKSSELRMHAAGVLHALEGSASAPSLRSLLHDENPDVVATAIALLAEQRDEASLEALPAAATVVASHPGRTDIPCDALLRLADWQEPRLIPVFIAFLDVPKYEGKPVEYWPAACCAQELLFERVGYGFPLNRASACSVAWQEVQSNPDVAVRAASLAKRLGSDHAPLAARLVPDSSHSSGYMLEVRNRGSQPLTVERRPGADLQERGRRFGLMPREREGRDAFVELKPSESRREHLKLYTGVPQGVRWQTSMTMRFRKDGADLGLKAWTGNVWVTLPPPADLVRAPTPEQRREFVEALDRVIAAAKAHEDLNAAEHLALKNVMGYDDWDAPLSTHDSRQEERVRQIFERLRMALEGGEPSIVELEVRGGADGKRNGPFLDAKVRFGAGPASRVLRLRFRRVLGRLLLGVVQRY